MSRTGFIQNEMDLKLLVLYIMDRAVAPITFCSCWIWPCVMRG